MLKILAAVFAALSLTACSTLDGIGARIAASDVSIVETALFIHRVRGVDLDLSDLQDRIVVYRAVDSYSDLKSGEITEEDFIAEIDRLLEEG